MKNSKLGVLSVGLPLALGLTVALSACGGNDSGGGGGLGGAKTASGGSNQANGGSSASDGGSPAGTGGAGKAGGASGSGGRSGSAGGSSSAGSSSGGSASSGDDFMSGLPGNKLVSDLTDAQLNQLCEEVSDYIDPSEAELNCRGAGLSAAILAQPESDAEARVACKSGYDVCQADPGETEQNCKASRSTCTATVAELEACASDSNDAIVEFSKQYPSCSEITLLDLTTIPGSIEEPETPASCVVFNSKCSARAGN
ncbi:MAG TPA: hypothetical protein VEQ58_15320 [Polyangiaceae bacterium]|nr:hypothetical protein [Polyangiaceae bacterium]